MPTTTTLFKTGNTQTVRLPKDVAFPDSVSEVEIIKVGSSRVISPAGHRWDAFFATGPHISNDFDCGSLVELCSEGQDAARPGPAG